MTHQDDAMFPVPRRLMLKADAAPEPLVDIRLVVRGQGTIGLTFDEGAPFSLTIGDAFVWGASAFRWEIGYVRAALFEWAEGAWTEIHLGEAPANLPRDDSGTGLDRDPGCTYWFSVDCHNRALGYGTGEVRLETRIAEHRLPPAPKARPDPYGWLTALTHVALSPPKQGRAEVWRDPVVVRPALKVVPMDAISMVDMARGEVTVPANLTPECQRLYGTVAGEQFVLDAPDFPQFGQAIQASIDDPDGWCAKTLAAKAEEFGTPNPKMTYLRITMGFNQGESPGIPFVMEIWPHGHFSPIHNHSAADAVIRVLRGRIHVSLYRMLSPMHLKPFDVAEFKEGDVTWISPTLNQTHQLHNYARGACVTIQCYNYPESDVTHYPYFDYIQSTGIGHFTPNSDMDFIEFRALMQKEWSERRAEKVDDAT